MKDFKSEIDQTDDPNVLRDLLEEIAVQIEWLDTLPYQRNNETQHSHTLELLLRYGEHKLEKLLS
ncbi:MAG TPA: hypothetical protein VHD90_22085 [Phototrophicaceae bacterium]|nr:hypothetical protein [Phototrophicaceae bacterium]